MLPQDLQEIISPKFTEKVLHDIVKKKSGLSDIVVKKIDPGAASKKGDSYLSTIYRFTVQASGKNKKGKEETVSIPVIVKFLPKNVARAKTYRSAEFFENEVIFFDKVWEPLQKFQESAGIKKKFDNIPLVLASYIDGTDDFVALLDLSHEGYTTAQRGSGLDYTHTVAILKVLAGFHALSLAFKDQKPDEFEKAASCLKETYFAERLRPWYETFQQGVFRVNRDAVSKELPPEYLARLNKAIDNDLYGRMVRSCEVRGPLSVVTHGDVWPPNFLIQYEGAELKKIAIIDFQLSRYTTLATDLSFFLYSCVDMGLVETKWDELIAEYHRELVKKVEDYGSSRNLVPLEALHKELQEYSVLGVGISMEALIMAQLEDDDVSDLDGIKGDQPVPLESVWKVHPFQEKEKRLRIAKMIKDAVDRNFI